MNNYWWRGLAPKDFVPTADEDLFLPKTRVLIVATMRGENIFKWATSSSFRQARRGFLEWFKKRYPDSNPPRWEDILVFRNRKQVPPPNPD